jgi:hypothetical protein
MEAAIEKDRAFIKISNFAHIIVLNLVLTGHGMH